MKMISKFALAAAVSIGAVATFGSAPAIAKEKQKAAPPLELSEPFRKAAQDVKNALDAKDFVGAGGKIAALEAVAKNDDEHYIVSAYRLQIAANQNDNPTIMAALDQLLANPKTPSTDLARFNLVRGQLAVQAKKPGEAVPFLLKARELGSTDPNLPLLLATSMIDSGNVQGGVAEIAKAIAAEDAAGRKAPEAWYSYAVSRLYKSGDRTATADWLMREVTAYPSAENWRKIIAVYRDSRNAKNEPLPKAEKLDLYRLQHAAGALADAADYNDYANAAQNSGLPWESLKILNEGKANGKLNASSPEVSALLSAASNGVKAESPLEVYEKKAVAAAAGAPAAQTGDAYLASGNYAKAAELYRMALQKGGVNTDEVNTRLGIALAHTGDKAGAKEAFAKVVNAPRVDIAKFWIAWLDLPAAAPAANQQ